jgi:hypothetical protein
MPWREAYAYTALSSPAHVCLCVARKQEQRGEPDRLAAAAIRVRAGWQLPTRCGHACGGTRPVWMLTGAPPLQLPAPAQSITLCTDSRAEGQAPLRTMLILSARAEVEANAQQLPQYWGMCWLRVMDR